MNARKNVPNVEGAITRNGNTRCVAPARNASFVGMIFVINLSQLYPCRYFDESWGSTNESTVRQTITMIDEGCGAEGLPDPDAQPTSSSPQITVRLLQELIANGTLTRGFGIPAMPEVRQAVCRPE